MTETCGRCKLETARTYRCEHTENVELCKECYQDVHWALTNVSQHES